MSAFVHVALTSHKAPKVVSLNDLFYLIFESNTLISVVPIVMMVFVMFLHIDI